MHGMFRMRFKKEILAEFLPPSRPQKKTKVIILCDGMPSIPRKQPLAEFLSRHGYWVVYPRYRGAWESGGVFLQKSPHQDILDIVDELPKGVRDIAFGEKFSLSPEDIFVIGTSFGGPAAILSSSDSRIKRVIAICPVVDWSILKSSEKAETSNRATSRTYERHLETDIVSAPGTGTSSVTASSTTPYVIWIRSIPRRS
jgi:esterase/lipase